MNSKRNEKKGMASDTQQPTQLTQNLILKIKNTLTQGPIAQKIVGCFTFTPKAPDQKDEKTFAAKANEKNYRPSTHDTKSMAAFVRTSRPTLLTNLFKQELTKLRAKKLCQAVVHGDYEEVRKILDQNPKLVLIQARVQDYSFGETGDLCRESEGTPLRLAWATGDISRKDHPNEGIANLIQSYFIKAFDNNAKAAKEEIIKQYKEQFPENEFPEYYPLDEKNREPAVNKKKTLNPDADVTAVETMVKALQDSKATDAASLEQDPELQNGLTVFRNHLKPKQVITKGKHFNMLALVKAFELYDQKYDELGGRLSPKNKFFWQKIIGYIQRFLPACDAQALFCQGIHRLINENQKLNRDLKLYGKPPYYPLDSNFISRLGYHYAASGIGGGASDHGTPYGPELSRAQLCHSLCQAKTIELLTVYHALNTSDDHQQGYSLT